MKTRLSEKVKQVGLLTNRMAMLFDDKYVSRECVLNRVGSFNFADELCRTIQNVFPHLLVDDNTGNKLDDITNFFNPSQEFNDYLACEPYDNE
jgi:hypothetical protein